jgi:hypothetical protein
MALPPGSRAQKGLESLERTDLATANRHLTDLEHGRGLPGRQAFQDAEHQDLAVLLGQCRQGDPNLLAPLLPAQARAGAGLAAEQPLGKGQGRAVRQTGRRFFAGHAAPPGLHVPAVQLNQSPLGHLPKPGVERQGPLAQVVVQPCGGLGQRLLDHVGGVHASRQAPVEADHDHAAQPMAVALQEQVARGFIAGRDSFEQVVGVGGHRAPSPLIARRGAECGRKKGESWKWWARWAHGR